MNNEPVELWIKNEEVKKAKFMDKNIDLSSLNPTTLQQIKDNPTRVVNGNNLIDNENFTKSLSKVIDSQLNLAMAKNDKKVLSRFARSDLVPDSQKENFIAAINQPTGIKKVLTNAINKVNQKVQQIAKRFNDYLIDKRDNIANQKLDKYLSSYQLKEFNKAPPTNTLDMQKTLNPELVEMAKHFAKSKGINDLSDTKTTDKILQDEFFQKAGRNGFSINDAKTALFQQVQEVQKNNLISENVATITNQEQMISNMQETIKNLQNQVTHAELMNASKNETLEDFEKLTAKMDQVDKIDVLIENKAYLAMNEDEKQEFEDKHIFSQNSNAITQAVAETVNLSNETAAIAQEAKEHIKMDKINPQDLQDKWKLAQIQNKNSEIPSEKFMNLSAVKFDGVSKTSLESWKIQMSEMRNKNYNVPTAAKVNEFIDASLKNAQKLSNEGVLTQVSPNEYQFSNEAAKTQLFSKELEKDKSHELKERLQDLSSPKAFEKIVDQDGKINPDRLMDYSQRLSEVATALQQQNAVNEVRVTMDDLKTLNQEFNQSQNKSQGQGMRA